ncbi:MAG TPA: purine-nucleoside phosphorylase [Rectinemataceae bacterium]|nr:purine-nucleoside phosphorylase [Rectinemataceae bacterium]
MNDNGNEVLPEGTPHISPEAPIAPTVLMPGDPLRAQYIAEHFLDGARRFNRVRGMLGFTGSYKGMPVSVMGSGMGIPSMGIYSYELFDHFGVQRILRLGTCGGYRPDMELGDIVMAQASSTNSSWASQYGLGGSFSAIPDFGLLEAAVAAARRLGRRFVVGNTLCLDQFSRYHKLPQVWKPWVEMGIVAGDMEAYALYCNAASLGKKALAMFTVSDLRLKDLHMSVEEREKALGSMIEVALESLV